MRLLVQRQTQACNIKFFCNSEVKKMLTLIQGEIVCLWVVCICLCVCLCVYASVNNVFALGVRMWMLVFVSVNVGMHTWVSEDTLGWWSLPFILFETGFLVVVFLWHMPGWLPGSFQGIHLPSLWRTRRLQMLATCLWLLCEFCGFKLGSSFLFGKHFYPLSHFSILSWKKFMWNIQIQSFLLLYVLGYSSTMSMCNLICILYRFVTVSPYLFIWWIEVYSMSWRPQKWCPVTAFDIGGCLVVCILHHYRYSSICVYV